MALKSNPQNASYIHPLSEKFDRELRSQGDFNFISVVPLLNEDGTPAITNPTNNITKKVVLSSAKNDEDYDRHLTKISTLFSKATTP